MGALLAMPRFVCLFHADCDHISKVSPVPGRRWGLKLQCSKCRENTEKFLYVDEEDTEDVQGGELQWPVSRASSAKTSSPSRLIQLHTLRLYLVPSAPIVTLDVRGGEPVALDVEDALDCLWGWRSRDALRQRGFARLGSGTTTTKTRPLR